MTASLVDLLSLPASEAAPGLLGWRLRSAAGDLITSVLVTEVEAYGGSDDPASHAYRGPTERNRSMYGPAGTLYVYRAYGIHWCANVVTGPAGEGQAILIRAGYPLEGIPIMTGRRGRTDHLADGPGKLCQALGIDGSYDGASLMDGPVQLIAPAGSIDGVVAATPRIGITKATDRPWRFVLTTAG